jgi:hypothetical protein
MTIFRRYMVPYGSWLANKLPYENRRVEMTCDEIVVSTNKLVTPIKSSAGGRKCTYSITIDRDNVIATIV